MKYLLRHTTCYNYSSSVTLSHNEARLLLRDLPWQKCANTRLIINPPPLRQHKRQDFFGNHVVYFAIQDIHDSLEVTVESEVTTQPRPKPDASMTMTWEDLLNSWRPAAITIIQ